MVTLVLPLMAGSGVLNRLVGKGAGGGGRPSIASALRKNRWVDDRLFSRLSIAMEDVRPIAEFPFSSLFRPVFFSPPS